MSSERDVSPGQSASPDLPLRERVAAILRYDDECGPCVATDAEYLDDADVLLAMIQPEVYAEGFGAGRAQGYQDGIKTAMDRLA